MTPEMKFHFSQKAKSEIQYWIEPYEMNEIFGLIPFKYQKHLTFHYEIIVWHQMPYG